MSSLQIRNLSSSSSSQKRVHARASINVPSLERVRISLPKNPLSSTKLFHSFKDSIQTIVPSEKGVITPTQTKSFQDYYSYDPNKFKAIIQLCAILKAVADRVEMHKNIGEERNNWNCLLLSSINIMMIRLNTCTIHNNALKLTSILLLTSAKGVLLIMNKIHTSKPNATTMFQKLQTDIETTIITRENPTEEDVSSSMERVLELDKAYPLSLSSGTKLETFPSKFEPITDDFKMKALKSQKQKKNNNNGWTPELEKEMRQIIEVVKKKDMEGYEKRGNLVLKLTKALAILGPLLTGIASIGSALEKNGSSWAGIVAIMAGSLADFINPLEGIVLELYKTCGGFLKDTIEAALEEKDYEKRENGELFEMKVAMKLGRSVCQLRQLAAKSAACDSEGIDVDEFSLQVMYSLLT